MCGAVAINGFCEDSPRADFLGKTESFREAHAVFEKSCLPCHSGQLPLPWYGRLPGMKTVMKKEYREAVEGFNFDAEIYVAGKRPSSQALDKIEETLLDGSMPPKSYRAVHWSARVSKSEREVVLKWIEDEREKMEETKPAPEVKEAPAEEEVQAKPQPFNPFKPI